MLEHGRPEATPFLAQLDSVRVTPWRCECGCASFNLVFEGRPAPSGGMEVLGDFVTGTDAELSGIFVFAQNSLLAGVEVYGMAGDAPKSLPPPESLRPLEHIP